MTSDEYKPTLVSNFAGYIRDKYLAIEIVLSLIMGVVLGFWTVLNQSDYCVDVALRRFEPSLLLTILYSMVSFFAVKKIRALLSSN